MNRYYEYATDKMYNLRGHEGNEYRKWYSLEMPDDPNFFLLAFIFLPLKSLFFCITWSLANLVFSMQKSSFLCRLLHCFIAFS